ncbi:DNA binding, putative isoform 2 [Hibiscus syriacus]|uniref:DNA binding, putative isoform 2 n=1 Tax=Hibiscus syriacus TaxID=106335 RepID=A0A6A2YJV6_HIBSY|nr:uncharacterized protein LOC120165105 [Hibiscus syriacus]XP_039030620.1 uncharacterized protein LOC120165105 [Hibiscus syriacus]XP_039030621.1 uncharacterized protein LOC120165105 [Hibiscus syriacus]KAE8676914.1 DNA binding, putative isoform 2 [Hibiscus syriacus]
MHAIKGGWVGQTFALAKCNEPGGKKSRVRRSKEERKAMVESFIKKYQESNSGNFPSLNLTHKEVGGSFYTVREIVREIIQENRVLGPAKLTEGEQSTDLFLQQNPLGSISTAPATLLSIQPNGGSFVPSHREDARDESVFSVTDELSMGSEYKIDSEQIINEDLVDVTCGTDKVAMVEVQVIEPLESDKSEKEMEASTTEVTQITADVVVETFPLRPVAKPTGTIDGMCSDVGKLNENLDQTENGKVNVNQENGSFKLYGMNSSEVSVLTDENEAENNEDVLLEKNSDLADKKVVKFISDPLLESWDCSTGGTAIDDTLNGAALEVSCDDILTSETNEQSQAIVGEAIYVPNGIHPKAHVTCKPMLEGDVTAEGNVEVQNANSKKGCNKTLDRINLESWEGTSKGAAESETNPLLAIFKSLVAAFVKFWSE